MYLACSPSYYGHNQLWKFISSTGSDLQVQVAKERICHLSTCCLYYVSVTNKQNGWTFPVSDSSTFVRSLFSEINTSSLNVFYTASTSGSSRMTVCSVFITVLLYKSTPL